MMVSRGVLVRWARAVEEGAEDVPYVVIKGPREGYFESKPLTRVVIVVDLYYEGKVMRGVPLDEVEIWS
jgi:hypothetical protein